MWPEHSDNFHQLSLLPGDLLLTYDFRQLSVWQNTFRQLPSTICAARRPSVKFPCNRETLHQLPSTFHAAGKPSVNFRILSLRPGDLSSTFSAVGRPSVNLRQLSCSWETFRQLPYTFLVARRPSFNFQCSQETFCQLQSTFRTARTPPANFLQLSVRPGDFPLTSVNFVCSRETFCQLSLQPVDLPSTFRADG